MHAKQQMSVYVKKSELVYRHARSIYSRDSLSKRCGGDHLSAVEVEFGQKFRRAEAATSCSALWICDSSTSEYTLQSFPTAATTMNPESECKL